MEEAFDYLNAPVLRVGSPGHAGTLFTTPQ